jgi:hypothetical protein
MEDNVRRTQHFAALFAALSLLPVGARAQAQAPTVEQIVTLVQGSPQLRIDETLFSSSSDAKTHPYVNIRNAPEGTMGGYLVPEGAHAGVLSDGTYALAVPLESEGSGGIFTQVVFAGKSASALTLAGYIESAGHLGVEIDGGSIVATLPYYGDDSPNCCPKKYIVQTYTVRDGRLVKLSERFEPARAE